MRIFQTFLVALVALFFIGCSGGASAPSSSASPSDVLKTFVEASKKKDIAAVKQTLSKGSLELVGKAAEAQKTTADELLARGNSDMIEGENPEISNEKIEGDTATVDVKVKTTGTDTIPFVKEDGTWKIAFDKYQQALVDKMRREMKPPEANLATNTNAPQPNAPANKPAANKPAANK